MHIHTKDGRAYSKQLDFPKGDPRNPLTDLEVEEKFVALADGVLSADAQKRVKDVVWNLERVGSVNELMELMEADIREAKSSRAKARTRTRSRTAKRSPVVA